MGRPTGRFAARAALAALFLLGSAVASIAGRHLELEEARLLEADGDAPAAARRYLSWARSHAGTPASLAGYAGFLRTERSLDAIVDAGRELAVGLPRVPESWPLICETALVFELAGLLAEAADLSLDAWTRGGPASLLWRRMRLSLAMGDLVAYQAAAARGITFPGANPLAAVAQRLTGRLEDAQRDAARIVSSSDDPQTRLAAAWSLFVAARTAGTETGLAAAASLLAQLFPDSPEAAIARAEAAGARSRVVEAASPELFAQAAAEEAGTGAAEPPAGTAAAFSVQAGSFQVRGNAEDLAKDLQTAGFAPSIRETAVQGKTVWRVYVAAGVERAAADRLLAALRAAGYDGLVVADGTVRDGR